MASDHQLQATDQQLLLHLLFNSSIKDFNE